MKRQAGVLLHITALPGPYGIGTLGAPARRFVDFLAAAGCSAWQVLPVNPPGEGYSPYQSPASQRLSPFLLSPDVLLGLGLLRQNELPPCVPEGLIDYPRVAAEWKRICALAAARANDEAFLERTLLREWLALRDYAHARGIELIGDLPIYVAPQSEEVAEHPALFLRDVVSGCPPDAFSKTGQRWNNPIYNWDAMERDGYRFWIARMRRAMQLFDRVRLDHFRGFCAYWAIPEDAPNASCGRWQNGPGMRLFSALRQALGELPLIAEDLGYITEDVHALRRALHIPGMAVLQFAFDAPNSPYLPERIAEDTVCYTGTHDNDTTLGWARGGGEAVRRAMAYFGVAEPERLCDAMITAALRSRAQLAVLPMQDLLLQDSRYRMNRPGTPTGNWRYRVQERQLSDALAQEMRRKITDAKR